MAWTTVVQKVISEYRNKDGDLNHRWEITRLEDGNGKHFDAAIQKTSYYKKDGSEVRGYPQSLTSSDLAWMSAHWGEILLAMTPKPSSEAPAATNKPVPTQEEFSETPF